METSGKGELDEMKDTVESAFSVLIDETNGDDPVADDPYHYTKRGEFTSELYKICVENLPHYVGYQQMRKTFSKLNVEPKKLKFDPKSQLAFLTFRSENERERAIEAITGYKFKKNILNAKKAMPKPDPQLRKRQLQTLGQGATKRAKIDNESGSDMDHLPAETRLKYVVAPLCDMPYSEQLKLKAKTIKEVLRTLTKDLVSSHSGSWVTEGLKENENICCKVEDIIPSPVVDNYRNKVEYNIGPSSDTKLPRVGFRLGTYKADNFAVVSPSDCVNISDEAKKIAKIFQDFLEKSDRIYYDPGIHTGYWRQQTVRNCRSGEIMVIVQVNPQDMTESELDDMKLSLKNLFFAVDSDLQISSLYLQLRGQTKPGEDNSGKYEHIAGSKVIYEEMMGMKFQISPDAFFQINTLAAELLYAKVREWCGITEDTTVLDVCCGTGTIGLSLAKAGAQRVIGVELCQQAIDDAKENAKLNEITNAEFICGKAEEVLSTITDRLTGKTNVVAVVDPPRAGLHKKVILALRRCLAIKRLVFVSCDAKKASVNFLDLCRPTTNRNKGTPYRLIRAVPMDLFPHTKLCELVLLMEHAGKDIRSTEQMPSSSNYDVCSKESSSEQLSKPTSGTENVLCSSSTEVTLEDEEQKKLFQSEKTLDSTV